MDPPNIIMHRNDAHARLRTRVPHRELVDAGAPNTEPLREPRTGAAKPMHAVLMGDVWGSDPASKALCQVLLDLWSIEPAVVGLPRTCQETVAIHGC